MATTDLAAAAERMATTKATAESLNAQIAEARKSADDDQLKRKLEESVKKLEEQRAETAKVTTPNQAQPPATAEPAAPGKAPAPQPAAAPGVVAKKSAIAVRKGRIRGPRRFGVYGPEGTGKTTLVSSVPGIIMMDIEGGSEMVDVPRFEFRPNDRLGYIPRSLDEWRRGIKTLIEADHDYRALGLDTMDALEPLIIKFVCKRDGYNSIEDYGYGKGYTAFSDEFRAVLLDLDRVREKRGMDIVITAHAQVKAFKNPSGEDFDRYQVKLHERVAGLFKEWCHELGFIHFDQGITKKDAHAKAKGWSTGKRVMEFDRTAAWDAKARLPLPSRVEIGITAPWYPFERAIDLAFNAGPDQIIALIIEQCERIGDVELTAKVQAATDKVKSDVSKLNNYLYDLRRRDPVPRKSEDGNTEQTTEETA